MTDTPDPLPAEELEPYPCPLCHAPAVVRSRLSARMTCGACGWEFVPPHQPGGWTPGVVIEVWEQANRDRLRPETELREGAMGLFQRGEFRLHSGAISNWKVECDALTDADLQALAALIAERIRFSLVYGVPTGGHRLAQALAPYATGTIADPILIADDVLTTGASMEAARARYPGREVFGVVLFARNAPRPWISAVWQFGLSEDLTRAPAGSAEPQK